VCTRTVPGNIHAQFKALPLYFLLGLCVLQPFQRGRMGARGGGGFWLGYRQGVVKGIVYNIINQNCII
jgi:hypothetical protein